MGKTDLENFAFGMRALRNRREETRPSKIYAKLS
jgi:hypothetical protein